MWALGGVGQDSAGKVAWGSSRVEGTCAPEQAQVACFPKYRSLRFPRLDWGRRCVPLTRGLRIPWGVPCGPLRVLGKTLLAYLLSSYEAVPKSPSKFSCCVFHGYTHYPISTMYVFIPIKCFTVLYKTSAFES